MRRYLSVLITVLTFALILVVLYKKSSVLKASFLEHKIYYIVIGLAYVGGRVLDSLRFKLLLKYFGMDIKIYESFGLSSMSPFYNLVFPNAGAVTNAIYMKSKYGLKMRHYVSIGLIESVSTVLVYSLIGIVVTALYVLNTGNRFFLGLILAYVVFVFCSIIVFFVPVPQLLKKHHVGMKLAEALEGFKDIRLEKRIIASTVIIQIAIAMLLLLRYYLTFNALLLSVPLINVGVIIPITGISGLLNILPANIGIREMITSSLSMVIGLSFDKGLLVAAVDRLVVTSITVIAGAWFFVKLKYSDRLAAVGRPPKEK